MMKNYLFGVALLSLALAAGCAKGGNGVGPPPPPTITVSDGGQAALYTNQTITFTATVGTPPEPVAVTWSLSGSACSGTPNPCGTIDSTTGVYQAPATVPNPQQITITATAQSNSAETGSQSVNLVYITTDVAPSAVGVGTTGGTGGSGLTQQFTAIAVPDDTPQTFTWTCTAKGMPCANFTQDPIVSGLAYYKGNDTCSGSCVQISATSQLDPTRVGCSANPQFCTIAKASLVTSRVNGRYAFRFSGFDSSNKATAVVGTFTALNGAVTSGVEDELTSSGWAQHSITGGSYTPVASDPNNSNNAGTLTLTTGAFPNQFQVVLDGDGDIEMIEADGHGSGSGIAQIAAATNLFSGNQTYAFGFTGVDSAGNRVGYVGVLPMDGSGTIAAGQMDVNDNGNTTNVCGPSPCSFVGTYSTDACNCGLFHMTLTAPSATMKFDFFISSGQTNKTNPLTFYAISTDPGVNPAVSGTMVLQDSTQTYNLAAFNGASVSALTGVNGTNANVSLTLGSTDGKGGFSGQFDQNNAGTILSAVQFPPQGSTSYNYAASGTNGRYTFPMLGNPAATPVLAPVPFILYASGQNRGFLLDQSSSSVMTGTMSPQGKGSGIFGLSSLPGTYGGATASSANSGVTPTAANLLLTSPGGGVFNVSGTQYPGPQTITGTYTVSSIGNGTITLTAPSAQNYVIYALDSSGCTQSSPVCAIEDFFMMDVDQANPNASIIFARQ